MGWETNGAGGLLEGERLWVVRHRGERVGMGARLLERQLQWCAEGWHGVVIGSLRPACGTGRLVGRRARVHTLRSSLQVSGPGTPIPGVSSRPGLIALLSFNRLPFREYPVDRFFRYSDERSLWIRMTVPHC